jgi:hypothetical protein
MAKKFIAFFFLFLYAIFLVTPVLAQSPEPPSEDQDSSNTPIKKNIDDIVGGPVGKGTSGEACRTDVNLDKSKIVDNFEFNIPLVPKPIEDIIFGAMIGGLGGSESLFKDASNQINSMSDGQLCLDGSTPSTEDPNEIAKGNCRCMSKASFTTEDDFCSRLKEPAEAAKCVSCATQEKGVWTAVGCINYDFSSFVTNILFKMGVGLGGMIALGCIVYASVVLQTSQGEPEKIQHARELITSCIIGLLLIIFSIFILQFIGVQLLDLNQFGAPLN